MFIVFDGYGKQDSQYIEVQVIPVNDPPVLEFIKDISFNEGSFIEVVISAYDFDPEDTLEFSCIGSQHINCSFNEEIQFDGVLFHSTILLESESDFYGFENIKVIVDDGFKPSSRYIDQQDVLVNILAVNDIPKIKPIAYSINNDKDIPIKNNYQITLNESDALSITFKISDPDSLKHSDVLNVNHYSLGLVVDENGLLDTETIDLDKVCTFNECQFFDKNTDGVIEDEYARCILTCHPDFSGKFIQKFLIDDEVTLGTLVSVDMILDVKQVNDQPNALNLQNNIFSY